MSHNFMKIVEFRFHSPEYVVGLDSLSDYIFIDPGKYSGVIVIFLSKGIVKFLC